MTVDYDDLHGKWDAIHLEYGSPTYSLRRKLIFSLILNLYKNRLGSIDSPIHILDVGCGTGDYAIFLARKGFFVTGVDFSKYAIQAAIDKCYDLAENSPQFIVSDIKTFQTTKKYDLILISEVLEHIDDDRYIIEKYRDFCKLNGHILISVPFDPTLWSFEDEQAGHLRRYTNAMIDGLFQKTKFRIVSKSWIGFPTIKLMWLLKTKVLRQFICLSNPARGTTKSSLIKFISGLMVNIDSYFFWIKSGVGIIILAKKI